MFSDKIDSLGGEDEGDGEKEDEISMGGEIIFRIRFDEYETQEGQEDIYEEQDIFFSQP